MDRPLLHKRFFLQIPHSMLGMASGDRICALSPISDADAVMMSVWNQKKEKDRIVAYKVCERNSAMLGRDRDN